ncbi:chemotaxis protein CheA [Uliginosibacterium sp. 31-16]|uniref:chemotaxis protein CheA n=1 Tax=Uliginosibacterium sp. 31-16 TaxID=3068315 RepID=UPI00273DC6D6|nr:chemotaxis protein CheA [Uliginosibacterium sp. 31-16]MDP5240388.1 chemotaxis protein CheA [Uliginosibacterium sp. 31-16]
MDPVREAFIAECNELLTVLDESLLALEKDTSNPDLINAIFRAVHTIKGGAGIIECRFIESFVHVLENVLDDVREGRLGVESALLDLMFSCIDQVRALLPFVVDETSQPSQALLEQSAALHALLHKVTGSEAVPPAGSALVAVDEAVRSARGSLIGHDCWHVSIRFGENVLREGMDPLSFIRYLASFGEIAHITTLTEALPPAAEMDPESCYLGFEIDFRSDTSKEKIERVFEFVRDSCLLHILPPDSRINDYIDLIMSLPEDNLRLGEILVRAGVLTEQELRAGLSLQQQDITDEPAPAPLGAILVGQQVVQKELVEAAVSKQAQISEKKAQEAQLIRVHADKLDHLINLVGELVIAGSAASMQAQRSHDPVMSEATSTISRLVEEVRDSALRLRMVQIGDVFTRFQRVVRDVSKEIGKDIELQIRGEDTELDKSVVDKIGDPLMHLVRNAMDHGIESAGQRLARGKPARGQLGLNAYHESGSVVIEVSDDGGGLNRQKIRDKAIARGLIAANAELSDADLCRLIFEPGFSTAEQVSSLSGRGVGMDVVRRNIEALRGTVDVESREGEGSLIRIRLPLTLAIIDGFLMGVGGSAYVVPLEMVEECIERGHESVGRNYINLRGEVLPCIRLREFLEIGGQAGRRENIVVVRYGGRKAGLLVDELMGEFQTVIKPLGRIFNKLRGVAGSTILGGGEVALILDVPALIGLAVDQEKSSRALGTASH